MLVGVVFLGSRHGRAVNNWALILRHGGLLRQVTRKTLQGASAPVEASRGFSTMGGDESQRKQLVALQRVLGYFINQGS